MLILDVNFLFWTRVLYMEIPGLAYILLTFMNLEIMSGFRRIEIFEIW